jgi:hypothetical protein
VALFTIRSAVVVIIALVAGVIAFSLAFLSKPPSGRNVATAALIGISAAGATLLGANQLLGDQIT